MQSFDPQLPAAFAVTLAWCPDCWCCERAGALYGTYEAFRYKARAIFCSTDSLSVAGRALLLIMVAKSGVPQSLSAIETAYAIAGSWHL
jgi:hypothetical protein